MSLSALIAKIKHKNPQKRSGNLGAPNKTLVFVVDSLTVTAGEQVFIELAEDVPSEEDVLFERLRKLDMPIG